ncbi:MAG: hypothetical protein QG597_2277 [Actinomycetota bacterium]|nr:hypothetical protein [Actinomycetota bacterium]
MAALNIDTEGVRGAAATAAGAPTIAPTTVVTVTPCAADAVSVQMATRLAAAAAVLNATTIGIHSRIGVAADHLAANAGSYDAQELASSHALTVGGGPHAGVIPVVAMAAPPAPPTVDPPGLPAGPVPVTGHHASTLIHTGPGATGLDSAATQLDNHAVELEHAAAQVRSARSATSGSWSSSAADKADAHLRDLELEYTRQADGARQVSQQIRNHAEDYRHAKASIPAPRVFEDLTQRLRTAVMANSTAPTVGLYAPAITALQGQLAEANHTALSAYQRYSAGAISPPGASPLVSEFVAAGDDSGSNPGGTTADDRSGSVAATTDLAADADAGGGDLGGVETLTGGGDAAAGGEAGGAGTELLGTVIPAVLGGVTGLVGGLVGGLSAARQGVQQAGAQLVGGLTQAASAAAVRGGGPDLSDQFGAGDGDLGGTGDFGGEDVGGGGDFGGGGGDFGGGDYGGTSPAAATTGTPGIFPAAAPVSAAPVTFRPTAAEGLAGAPAAGGPGMMPPMMPMGMAGAGGGDGERRLYPERRLRVEAPPNAEPVKGRREARKGRGKDAEEAK